MTCPYCNGELYFDGENGEWRCIECGHRATPPDDHDDEEYAHTASPH